MSNTVILSLDKYPQDPGVNFYVEKLNIMFACFFVLELIVKMCATGCKQYFKGSMFNTFDCLIVLASIIDILLSSVIISHDAPSYIENVNIVPVESSPSGDEAPLEDGS